MVCHPGLRHPLIPKIPPFQMSEFDPTRQTLSLPGPRTSIYFCGSGHFPERIDQRSTPCKLFCSLQSTRLDEGDFRRGWLSWPNLSPCALMPASIAPSSNMTTSIQSKPKFGRGHSGPVCCSSTWRGRLSLKATPTPQFMPGTSKRAYILDAPRLFGSGIAMSPSRSWLTMSSSRRTASALNRLGKRHL